jgi:hypothetical protein
MPTLEGPYQFTGTLHNLTAYKMRGSDKIILRRKGGPSKKQVRQSPRFEHTRRNNREFGGRSRAAQRVRRILAPLRFLADHNFTGPLNALFKHIQLLDTAHEWGQRSILLSRQPKLLEGFNLNRRFLFDSLVRVPLAYSISKENLQAVVHVPALLPKVNLSPAGAHPWFKIMAVMGIIPDLVYTANRGYQPEGEDEMFGAVTAESDWLPVSSGSAAFDLSISITHIPKTPSYSCLLAVGMAMGTMQQNGIRAVPYVGGAKVLAVV